MHTKIYVNDVEQNARRQRVGARDVACGRAAAPVSANQVATASQHLTQAVTSAIDKIPALASDAASAALVRALDAFDGDDFSAAACKYCERGGDEAAAGADVSAHSATRQ